MKNFKEFNNDLNEAYISDAEYFKISKEVQDYAKKEVNSLLKKYPANMKSWFGGLKFYNRVTSEFDGFTKEIRISNLGGFSSVKEADRLIKNGSKPGFGVGEDLQTLIVHEFAHGINIYIIDKLKVYEKQVEWSEAKDALLPTLKHRSEYSHKNDREQFAEQYTYEFLYGNGKGPLNKLIDEWIKKVGKK